MITAAPVPLALQIACVKRELALRKNVYARRVADHKMRQGEADLELSHMAAVLDTLERLAAGAL
jgi:hypothetical protein